MYKNKDIENTNVDKEVVSRTVAGKINDKLEEQFGRKNTNFTSKDILTLHNINLLHAGEAVKNLKEFSFPSLGKLEIPPAKYHGRIAFAKYVNENDIDLETLSTKQEKELRKNFIEKQRRRISKKEDGIMAIEFYNRIKNMKIRLK